MDHAHPVSHHMICHYTVSLSEDSCTVSIFSGPVHLSVCPGVDSPTAAQVGLLSELGQYPWLLHLGTFPVLSISSRSQEGQAPFFLLELTGLTLAPAQVRVASALAAGEAFRLQLCSPLGTYQGFCHRLLSKISGFRLARAGGKAH